MWANERRRYIASFFFDWDFAKAYITVRSQVVLWRLRSPASRLFPQPFVRAHIKENIKALCYWPLWGESTGDQLIPLAKGQQRGKCFHLMTSSCKWKTLAYLKTSMTPHQDFIATVLQAFWVDYWKTYMQYMNLHFIAYRDIEFVLIFILNCKEENDITNFEFREQLCIYLHIKEWDVIYLSCKMMGRNYASMPYLQRPLSCAAVEVSAWISNHIS